MHKILIVDDKSLIRQGLIKKINWERLGAELAGEAGNGQEALNLIDQNKPDIVITDIRMPEFDGINLLKQISRYHPEIQTIVISGYDDFEYAQQAIKNGSLDYILKPINTAELNASIKKACDIVEDKKRMGSVYNRDQLTSEYLYRLSYGMEAYNGSAGGFIHRADIADGIWCEVVVKNIPAEYDREKRPVSKKFSDAFKRVYSIQNSKELLIFFGTDAVQDINLFENRVLRTVQDFINTEFKDFDRVTAGIGKPCKTIAELSDAYKTACEAAAYRLLEQNRKTFTYSELSKKRQVIIPIEEYESRISLNVVSGNLEEVRSILDRLMEKLLSNKDITLDSVRLHINNLCHTLLKIDTELSLEIQSFLKKMDNSDYLLSFEDISSIINILHNLYRFTTQKYIDNKGGRQSTVLKVMDFINKNYSRNISLEEMSRFFHFSVPYLSKVFKEEIRQNVNEYITSVRINEAKKLLAEGNISIPALARMVGFSDHMYFHKVFKKVTGMTPKEFQARELGRR